MKRLGIFVLTAVLAACLAACGQGEGAGMSIKPRQLSQETREVLEIFGKTDFLTSLGLEA